MEILNFKSLTCDCNSLECPDATICSDRSDPKLNIAVYTGYVFYSIEINGKRFGTEGGDRIDVQLQHGEKILKMVYGISRDWPDYEWHNTICGLNLMTNFHTYGPYFSPWCPNCRCEFEYLVSIPDEMTFLEFLAAELKLEFGLWNYWILGFNSEILLLESKNSDSEYSSGCSGHSGRSRLSCNAQLFNGLTSTFYSEIWHGEDNVLVLESDAGFHPPYNGLTYEISHMFDDDELDSVGDPTIWHRKVFII